MASSDQVLTKACVRAKTDSNSLVRTILLGRTFIPLDRDGKPANTDQRRRYETNLTVIFEANNYFSDFWRQDRFWEDLTTVLFFQLTQSPLYIEEIVNRYLDGRKAYLYGGGRRNSVLQA